jgi:hypothetical protein
MIKPEMMRTTRAAAAECTISVLSHYTIAYICLHYRSRWQEGFASVAASDKGFLANPISRQSSCRLFLSSQLR